MANKLLSLHISQTQILLDKATSNNYSDEAKQKYQVNLFDLFGKIKSSITDTLSESEIYIKLDHLQFIFDSLEFLKDSTLNSIPFEIVSCLKLAMSDWQDPDKFIIVTSLKNNIDFSYDPSLALNDFLFKSLEVEYGIIFEKRLVQINLPLILSKDYFSAVVLYHELGHFIDLQNKISQTIASALFSMPSSQKRTFLTFLPFLDTLAPKDLGVLSRHVAEYFCDIFASQYIGETSNHYLKYITKNSDKASGSHPATTNRVKMVEWFINNTNEPLLDLIKTATEKLTGKQLIKRHNRLASDDFYKLIPIEIDTAEDLHGIFSYGWDVYLDDLDKFRSYSYTKELSHSGAYKILNNLMEKSIGNYFILKDWSL